MAQVAPILRCALRPGARLATTSSPINFTVIDSGKTVFCSRRPAGRAPGPELRLVRRHPSDSDTAGRGRV